MTEEVPCAREACIWAQQAISREQAHVVRWGKVSMLTVARGTKPRGREHVSWAESLGNVEITHGWDWGQHGIFISTLLGIYFGMVWKPIHPNVHTGGVGMGKGCPLGADSTLDFDSYWTRMGAW